MELQILDYPSQQYRLLPLLAAAVAFFFSGRAVLTMLRETEAALADGSTGQVRAGGRVSYSDLDDGAPYDTCTALTLPPFLFE